MGEASQLVPSEGTIEMIRKTTDDRVEEYMIKGNKLIDADGVFCYQIPMNLDFVRTDEYGNIVPTDNPTKGIPTRARVRFRFTLNETDNEALSSHKARYLVPNNPSLIQRSDITEPYINKEYLDTEKNNNNYYEFGTLTNDECFRDLLWNKVYSVKSYIPRVQKINTHETKTKSFFFTVKNAYADGEKNQDYIAIKGVNKKTAYGMNPLPFNKLDLNFSIPTYHVLRKMWDDIFNGSWDDFFENGRSFAANESPIRRFWSFLNGRQIDFNMDAAVEKSIEDTDGLGLDFYNDWLNGCLYFPNWYWYLAPGERNNSKNNEYNSKFCDCDESLINYSGENENVVRRDALCVFNNCSLPYSNSGLTIDENFYNEYPPKSEIYIKDSSTHHFFKYALQKYNLGSRNFIGGIIKKKTNKDGAILYYYSFGQKRYNFNAGNTRDKNYGINYADPFVRLFSTDIILLGSLDDNDIHGIPKVSVNIPSTTSNIPPLGRYKDLTEIDGNEYEYNTSGDTEAKVNGMNWGQYWFKPNTEPRTTPSSETPSMYRDNLFGTGLFFGISPAFVRWGIFPMRGLVPYTVLKTCVNVERMCELGVTNDSKFRLHVNKNGNDYYATSEMDGLITKRELLDAETRTLFASLNSSKLIGGIVTDSTGYKTYKLSYLYPSNFDGRLEKVAPEYTDCDSTRTCTKDVRNKDYLDFRFGTIGNSTRHFYGEPEVGYENYYGKGKPRLDYAFPLYENSFYFYFGMNAEHTAIGEFYKKFIRKCDIEDKKPFNVEIDIESATYCANNDGKIYVTVSEAALPYTVYIYKNGVEEKKIGSYDYETDTITFSNLSNGDYEIVVEDGHSETISKLAKLVQDKIRLNFTYGSLHDFSSCVSMNSTIEDEDLSECSQSTFVPYSYINLISYINNGITYDINSVTINSKTDKKMVIDIDNDVQVSIELVSDGSIGNVTIENGMLHIDNTFGNFYLTIQQKECPLINKNNYWAST